MFGSITNSSFAKIILIGTLILSSNLIVEGRKKVLLPFENEPDHV